MLRNSARVSLALALAIAIASGCALEEDSASVDEAALASAIPPSYTLHAAGGPFGSVTVTHTSPNGTPINQVCRNPCDLGFVDGTALTIRITHPLNEIDCMQFDKWTQLPCAGQSSTCHTTIHSNILATAKWKPLLGCDPQ